MQTWLRKTEQMSLGFSSFHSSHTPSVSSKSVFFLLHKTFSNQTLNMSKNHKEFIIQIVSFKSIGDLTPPRPHPGFIHRFICCSVSIGAEQSHDCFPSKHHHDYDHSWYDTEIFHIYHRHSFLAAFHVSGSSRTKTTTADLSYIVRDRNSSFNPNRNKKQTWSTLGAAVVQWNGRPDKVRDETFGQFNKEQSNFIGIFFWLYFFNNCTLALDINLRCPLILDRFYQPDTSTIMFKFFLR